MTSEIRLPQLAEGMERARLAAWLKREGDTITAGEPIAEIETDKTSVELEAPADGVLGNIRVPAGTDGVPVGALLAIIVPGEAAARAVPSEPTAAPAKAEVPVVAAAVAVQAPSPAAGIGLVDATPLASRMAAAAGIDLSSLRATNAGRITKADVERALPPSRTEHAARVPATPPAEERRLAVVPPRAGVFTLQPVSAMRRVTAARLQEAKQTIPHFYVSVDCRMGELVQLRARINTARPARITVTDFIVFAASRALRKVPQANAAWDGGGIRIFDSADIAVAVNTDQGLVAPVIRRCETKTLGAISSELKELSERARAGRLTPDEYSGGTFTVSNLGMYGPTSIVPIINPPQSCILGVGAIEERPCAAGGQVVIAPVLTATLSADHRVLDGVAAAALLAEFRSLVEQPLRFALEV